MRQGIKFEFFDKTVLEIGCGHEGISALLATVGASKVVGIARKFARDLSVRLGVKGGINVSLLR